MKACLLMTFTEIASFRGESDVLLILPKKAKVALDGQENLAIESRTV